MFTTINEFVAMGNENIHNTLVWNGLAASQADVQIIPIFPQCRRFICKESPHGQVMEWPTESTDRLAAHFGAGPRV